ncbi:lipocalin-15-like isoform X1 [Hirundo rustica]|uniref:lipocalin-15-like isoform X1 n=1 Tax=Hirundo rustica TaxID=43150 RepID=UPI001A940553|nr:lipocalin-15-like isoform X1 [Hirundo rustica]
MMSPSVWHFLREHGPGAAPVLLAWGRTGCSACRKVAGPHVCLAGLHRGWQVCHHLLAGFYSSYRFLQRCHAPRSGEQTPTDGGRSLKRVTGPHRQLQAHCRFQIFALGCQISHGGMQVPQQVPTTFPNSTGDVLWQFAGVWHVTAIASNCSIFLKMKDGMKSSMAIISFMPEGDLAMKLVWPLMDKCQTFELLFQQSEQAGHYMGAQEKRDLRVMETDYSYYAVLHEAHHSEGEPSTALQLLTREQDVSPQLLQKFMELISTMGLTEDMLAILPKSDQCTRDIS